jgi:hypothetical protein
LYDITKRIIALPLHLATFPDNKQDTVIKNATTSLMKCQSADELNGELVITVEEI